MQLSPGTHPHGLFPKLKCLILIFDTMVPIQLERFPCFTRRSATALWFLLRFFVQDPVAVQADQPKSMLQMLKITQKSVLFIAAVCHDHFCFWITCIQFLDLHELLCCLSPEYRSFQCPRLPRNCQNGSGVPTMNTCDHSAASLSCSTSTHFDPAGFLPAHVHWRWRLPHTLCIRLSFRCLPAYSLARAIGFHPYPFRRFPVHRTRCNTFAERVSVRSRQLVNLPDPQPSGRRSGRTKHPLAFSDFGILLFGTR